MKLSPMRFKQFIWPHNPRVYSTLCQRNMAVSKIPLGGYHLQNLGQTCRVFRGEGEFTGVGAYDTYKELEAVFREESAGILVHPVWLAVRAWFVSLKLEQEPRSDYVRYSFEFWEASDTGETTGETQRLQSVGVEMREERWHTMGQGETLWLVARQYGLTEEQILALNPAVSNPNLVAAGQEVRVT